MKVTVIGLGPGGGADLPGRARAALEACDLIVGYTAYIVENGDDAWCILCVCAQQEEAYAQRLLDVANTFAPAPEATPAATAVQE